MDRNVLPRPASHEGRGGRSRTEAYVLRNEKEIQIGVKVKNILATNPWGVNNFSVDLEGDYDIIGQQKFDTAIEVYFVKFGPIV